MKYNFIEKAINVHKNTYIYSKTVYVNKKTKVIITCKIHGDFLQSPQIHLKGSGCKKCYIENIKSNSIEFINKANKIHHNKYDYSKTIYSKSTEQIIIICPSHGEFKQEANSHLQGKGCNSCFKENKVFNTESFIKKANSIHKNKYNYSLVNYINSTIKIKIICNIHGEFLQTPNTHLDGSGCSICSKLNAGYSLSKFKDKCIKNNNGLGILYVIECYNDDESFYKIGITSKSIKKRYSSKLSMPYNYNIIQEIEGSPEDIFKLERLLHYQLYKYAYNPIIKFAGSAKECFKM